MPDGFLGTQRSVVWRPLASTNRAERGSTGVEHSASTPPRQPHIPRYRLRGSPSARLQNEQRGVEEEEEEEEGCKQPNNK